jgi:signal transduction histidine kinase
MRASLHHTAEPIGLRAAQIIWLLGAALALSAILAGAGPYAALTATPCAGRGCLAIQLTPEQAAAVLRAGQPIESTAAGAGWVAAALVPAAACLLIAAICAWRRAGEGTAMIVAWALTAIGASEFARALAQPWAVLLALVNLIHLAAGIGLTAGLCLLPDGRLPARWIGWLLAALTLAGVPLAFGALPGGLLLIWALALLGVAAASLVWSYATGAASARERLSWALAALVLLAGAQLVGQPLRLFPLAATLRDTVPAPTLALVAVNGLVLAIGGLACLAVALLRDELFDIELVLNRALLYGLLSVAVVAAYVLVVGYFSLLFRGSENMWSALVATGLIAAAFQPVRERLQRLVNQLLYGQRDEPGAAVVALGARLQQTLAPAAVMPAVVETVASALRVPYVAITLRAGDERIAAAYGVSPGSTLANFPLVAHGEEVGHLLVAPRTGETDLGAADRRLLVELAQQAGPAVHAACLTMALRHSREQLVAAREEERRRLRRELHDGLGPALASQALTADAACLLLERDPAAAALLLGEVKRQAQATVGEIRRVVHDLRPPALDDLGFVGALCDLAGKLSVQGMQVVVEAPDQLAPLPAAVEVAAYRIAAEALTNAARHSGASRCTLSLVVAERLVLTVADHGAGIPLDRRAGVGLHSMRERAEELGGTLCVETPAGGGTTVRATLPLERRGHA